MYPAPQPSPSSQPIPIGAIWQQSVALMRRHASLFMALAVLQTLPQLFLVMGLRASGVDQRANDELVLLNDRLEDLQSSGSVGQVEDLIAGLSLDNIVQLVGWTIVVLMLQRLVLRPIAQAAALIAVGDAYADGKPTFGRAMAGALPHFPALIGWGIVLVIGSVSLMLTLIIPLIGIFVCLGLMLFFGMRLQFVPQIIVAERAGTFTAMGRSWELSKGQFGRIFGAWLLFIIAVSIAVSFFGLIFSGIAQGIMGDTVVALAFSQSIAFVLALITIPLGYIGFTLLYYDLARQAAQRHMPPPMPPMPPPYT